MVIEDAEESEDFEDIVAMLIEGGKAKMHVGCFGRIVSYSSSTQTCSVRPVVRAGIKGGDPVQYSILTKVPIRFPAGGGYSMTWPLVEGDQVWLDFADRSIDEWANSSDPKDITPQSKRRFHISDAVALPGGRPGAKPLQQAGIVDLVIGQDPYAGTISNPSPTVDPLQLVIGPSGIGLGDGGTTNDLLNILDTLLTAIGADTVVQPNTKAVALAQQIILAKIKR